MWIVSVINIKGGVGKTTTAVILAMGLAEKDYKVLLIDSDPQTNLTMCFLQEQQDEMPSLYHVYNNEKSIDEVKIAVKEDVDLVPGDFSLCNADMQFMKAGRLKMLQKAIRSLDSEYDFIVVDTAVDVTYEVGDSMRFTMWAKMPQEMYGSWTTKKKKVTKYYDRCNICGKFFENGTSTPSEQFLEYCWI